MKEIILMQGDQDRVVNLSLYDFIKRCLTNEIDFLVCNVTEEEFKKMKKQICEGCLNERLAIGTCDYGYDKFRYMAAYNYKDLCIKFNDYQSNKETGSYILKDDKLVFDEDKIPFTKEHNSRIYCNYKIYTTETYEDVIKYYQRKSISTDLDAIISKVLLNPDEFYEKVGKVLLEEEYETLKQNIKDKDCSNCDNKDCDRSHLCDNWHNDLLVGKQKVLINKY